MTGPYQLGEALARFDAARFPTPALARAYRSALEAHAGATAGPGDPDPRAPRPPDDGARLFLEEETARQEIAQPSSSGTAKAKAFEAAQAAAAARWQALDAAAQTAWAAKALFCDDPEIHDQVMTELFEVEVTATVKAAVKHRWEALGDEQKEVWKAKHLEKRAFHAERLAAFQESRSTAQLQELEILEGVLRWRAEALGDTTAASGGFGSLKRRASSGLR